MVLVFTLPPIKNRIHLLPYEFGVPVWISLPVLFPRDLFVISGIDFVDELVSVKGFAT